MGENITVFRTLRLIKHQTIILILIVLLIVLAFVPTPAKGDEIGKIIPSQTETPQSPTDATIGQKPLKTANMAFGGVGDRTERIKVPPEEVSRVTALVHKIFPNDPIMVAVLSAESGFDCGIKNKISSARGCFQILKSTWIDAGCTGDVFNAEDNIKCAKKLFDKSGTTPWNESKGTWGNTLQHKI